MNNNILVPTPGTWRGRVIIIALFAALVLGLALASPAHGAELKQSAGDINGTVTVNGQSAAGVSVELRQRANSGTETSLATATTDATGTYHFVGQPSAPSDAFYYVRFTGGKGMLAVWNSFPIIYVNGSSFAVPSVEMGDVQLISPAQGGTLSLPGALKWSTRRSGETYRIFIYADGGPDASKVVLDSGSLGTGSDFVITGGLASGKYQAIVQVRDAVVGYGQSQARFRFSIGTASVQSAASATPAVAPDAGSPAPTQAPPAAATAPVPTAAQPPDGVDARPEIKVNLSADKQSVAPGDSIIYTIEVANSGNGPASSVVITDKLPAGINANPSRARSDAGAISIQGNTVTAQVGDLAPNTSVKIEIPASVAQDAGSNLSNQASANYTGASDAVQSNAYISQVAEPASGPPPAQNQQAEDTPTAQPLVATPSAEKTEQPASTATTSTTSAQGQPQNPGATPPSSPTQQASLPQNSQSSQDTHGSAATAAKPGATAVKQPSAPMPQTGGSFPVVFALLLVLFTLLARYLRGRSYRRV